MIEWPGLRSRQTDALQEVQIQVGYYHSAVDAEVASIVVSVLRSEGKQFTPVDGECRAVLQETTFYSPAADGQIEFPTGLLPRVLEALAQAGYRARIQDLWTYDGEGFTGNEARLQHMAARFRPFVEALRKNPVGLIEVPPGLGRADHIALICRYFDQSKFLIPCATISESRRIADELSGLACGSVDVVCKGTWNSPARVVVCTFTSFDTADPHDWQGVIFPKAENVLANKP